MITSKQIYPSLVDVFYGNKEFKQQEWVRCNYISHTGWRIAEWPVLSNKAETDYKCIRHLFDMIPAIHKHLEKHYGHKLKKATTTTNG
jgi:hypothetical protein